VKFIFFATKAQRHKEKQKPRSENGVMLSLSKQGYNEAYFFRHEDAKPQRKTKAALTHFHIFKSSHFHICLVMLSLSKQGYNEVYFFGHKDAKAQRKTKAALTHFHIFPFALSC